MSRKGNAGRLHTAATPNRLIQALLIVCVPLFSMTACSFGTHGDLVDYVQREKAKKGGRIAPMPEVKVYAAYVYDKTDLRDPFKVAIDEELLEAANDKLAPEIAFHEQRNKEPLESFPLDTLHFVGHLEQRGRLWAVVTGPDDLVYRVEEGNYLGQNYGRIVRVTESQIDIREIVPNGMGGWVERDATLPLAE